MAKSLSALRPTGQTTRGQGPGNPALTWNPPGGEGSLSSLRVAAARADWGSGREQRRLSSGASARRSQRTRSSPESGTTVFADVVVLLPRVFLRRFWFRIPRVNGLDGVELGEEDRLVATHEIVAADTSNRPVLLLVGGIDPRHEPLGVARRHPHPRGPGTWLPRPLRHRHSSPDPGRVHHALRASDKASDTR